MLTRPLDDIYEPENSIFNCSHFNYQLLYVINWLLIKIASGTVLKMNAYSAIPVHSQLADVRC